jgi:glycerol-3-phosphate O-acyltransferase
MNQTTTDSFPAVTRYEPGPLTRFGFWPALLAARFFSSVRVDPGAVEHIRALAARGSIVYVMRYRSLVDYMLIAYVLMREGLPLPQFVSDVHSTLLRPVREIVQILWHRLQAAQWFLRRVRRIEDRDRCQRLVQQGRPVLIFMRSRARGVSSLFRGRAGVARTRTGIDYLRDIVEAGLSNHHEVFLVPLAVLRGRGFRRKESRIATAVYSVQEAPGEIKRLLSLLWNARDTSITVGKQIAVRAFAERYGGEGHERLLKRIARALQIFLYREERVVWGPTLLPKHAVRQLVLQDADLTAVVRRLAIERGQSESQLWRTAERYFDEMAANFHGSFFAFLEFLFSRIWPRVFQGFEYTGLEKVTECVKQGPVVLVPCHRSHFDYLILSYLFHANYLSPPHIAAGINLSFWPLGPLFRGAGAYFIRRTFEGNDLYKAVFRSYLAFLIRQGYTQEFFIEGGRSRTGKILTPRLGMLSAIVNAFIAGGRRDLYLVPVSIQYARIVEEESYKRELVGAQKEKESLLALIKARTVLRQKRGVVYVTFADPISLHDVLGGRRGRFHDAEHDPAVEEEKRRFTQKLGFRLLREVNAVAVAGPSPLAATVLLSSPANAWRYPAFLDAAHTLLRFLRHEGVRVTAALERDAERFGESLTFLESSGLIRRLAIDGGVIQVPPEKRITLDFYKNNTLHFFLLPALLSRALRAGLRGAALKDEVSWWLDLYRWEFPLPERETVAVELGRLLEYFRADGALIAGDGDAVNPEHPLLHCTATLLDNFCEAYWMTVRSAAQIDGAGVPHAAFLAATRQRFETYLLLGEVRWPEGNSSVTFGNAVSRLVEVGYLTSVPGAKGKERVVQRGARFSELSALDSRLAAHLHRRPAAVGDAFSADTDRPFLPQIDRRSA